MILLSFNPLAGIRCFLTCALFPHQPTTRHECFNPLAGIRCFLTRNDHMITLAEVKRISFNPLAGIRCFLTVLTVECLQSVSKSFNPLAGIRCFLTTT